MPTRILALLLLTAGVATPALADDVSVSAHCSRDYAPAVDCRLGDTVGADGQHTMNFVAGDKRTQFIGRSQSGWWSGKLDGKPAMGYELNRGHVVISTTDLESTFEWWSDGNQHGSY